MSDNKIMPETPVNQLKGVGKTKMEQLKRKNIETVRDLVRYYPRKYEIYEEPCKSFDEAVCTGNPILAVVSSKPKTERKSGKCITKATMSDKQGTMFLASWFNMTGAALGLTIGKIVVLDGKCVTKDSFNMITHPIVYDLSEYEKLIGKPQPVYGLTEGLTNTFVSGIVKQALDTLSDYDYSIPGEILEKRKFPKLTDTLRMIHFPENEKELKKAEKYIAYEEVFDFMYELKKNQHTTTSIKNNFSFTESSLTDKIKDSLPFQLTNGQIQAINDIRNDLNSDVITKRLIQGDVSCGKTLVAILSLLFSLENNYQSVLLAPTEVLAKQHYNELVKYARIGGMKNQIRLLTSETKKNEKEMIRDEAVNGFPICVVGTHSVINMAEDFNCMALCVIDEQHKFGVVQRESMLKNNPHVITMTATPIPRSLSLTIYGSEKCTEIKELPSNRLPIKNCVVGEKMIENAYRFIRNQIKEGHQAYVVCPAIKEADGMSLHTVESVVKALQEYIPGIKVAALHGKADKQTRETVIKDFTEGIIDVLVATTVIEVGVNVANATTIMIMNSERYGLASLHQLRGRVGRGNLQSYCIFIDGLESKDSMERMNIISSTNDGFVVAQEDLVIRGPGELLGTEQSGAWGFKKADITNEGLLNLVNEDINTILSV